MSWLHLPEGHTNLESYLCSLAQEADSWQQNGSWDSEQSDTLSGQTIPSQCSKPESETDSLMTHQSLETLGGLTGSRGEDLLMCSPLASHNYANLSALEARSTEKTIPATAGQIPFALLERSGPHGFFWRTPQTSFSTATSEAANLISSESLRSWPAWGMWDAMAVYPLEPLDSSTNGDGCGLLPTPVARDGKSFYVVTYQTALRIMNRSGSKSRQLHWSQFGTVFHNLKKGWANPRFSEAMMGWPIGFTDLRPLEKGRFQEWLRQHGDYLEE